MTIQAADRMAETRRTLHLVTPTVSGYWPEDLPVWPDDAGTLNPRAAFYLDDRDAAAFDNLGRYGSVNVTERTTGLPFLLERAACGLGCRCAAVAVLA